MKGTKQDASSLEGQSGRTSPSGGACPYREAHTLSIDPAALEIIDREESRRLRVLPLEVGPDGPIFAVAEPSEERFAEVRELAGDNATFVVVARETLDALLNSKVFSVPNSVPPPLPVPAPDGRRDAGAPTRLPPRRATRRREPAEESAAHDARGGRAAGRDARPPSPPTTPSIPEATARTNRARRSTRSSRRSPRAPAASAPRSNELNESLEAAQRELRHSNEQLAEAHKNAEAHHEIVAALNAEIEVVQEQLGCRQSQQRRARPGRRGADRREIDSLRDQLAKRTAVNDAMTARLEEVARALMDRLPAADEG